MIVGNMIGGCPSSPKTCTFLTSSGQEIQAVLVDSETIFTAEPNDVREGKTFASDIGMGVGTKVIPACHTVSGLKVIPANSQITITVPSELDIYDYTQLQSIICSFNSSLNNSVSAEKITIGNDVYNVRSTESIATIIKNHSTKTIDLGIVNDSGAVLVIRYFMYKEIE